MCTYFRMLLIPALVSIGCGRSTGQPTLSERSAVPPTKAVGNTVVTRFQSPAGFIQPPHFKLTFADYLHNLPLKPEGAEVHLFDGSLKRYQGAQAAVIDMSVGTKDLQQCADAVMRLRAEYLFAADRKDGITFNFTNGFRADFARWANGERIQVRGNQCLWKGEGRTGYTRENLMGFLQQVFTYAGTLSLEKELVAASRSPVEIGDVFIHGGSPGHAMIVVDVASNSRGEQVFMLAQSYMPAQEIHVVKNPNDPALSPWFKLNEGSELVTPEWTFRWDQRKRWP